jgi:hypothetical protein
LNSSDFSGINIGAGVADATAGLNTYLGIDTHSGGTLIQTANFSFFTNNSFGTPFTNANAVGHVYGYAIDYSGTNPHIWVQDWTNASGWTNSLTFNFTGNPVTGVEPLVIATTSPIFIIGTGGYQGSIPETMTLNTGATAFTGTIPSGFTAWDTTQPPPSGSPPIPIRRRVTRWIDRPIIVRR